MPSKYKPLSAQLREAILKADISRYRIAKETGLSQAALSRFIHHVANLSLDSIDKVGECIGLRLVVDPKPDVKRTKKKGK